MPGVAREPSVGRIVHYKLSKSDVEAIGRRRVKGAGHNPEWPAGAQAHVGNQPVEGETMPMVVCVVWPNEFGDNIPGVNGQVFLDGNDSLWITSAKQGDESGQWNWPPIV